MKLALPHLWDPSLAMQKSHRRVWNKVNMYGTWFEAPCCFTSATNSFVIDNSLPHLWGPSLAMQKSHRKVWNKINMYGTWFEAPCCFTSATNSFVIDNSLLWILAKPTKFLAGFDYQQTYAKRSLTWVNE